MDKEMSSGIPSEMQLNILVDLRRQAHLAKGPLTMVLKDDEKEAFQKAIDMLAQIEKRVRRTILLKEISGLEDTARKLVD